MKEIQSKSSKQIDLKCDRLERKDRIDIVIIYFPINQNRKRETTWNT